MRFHEILSSILAESTLNELNMRPGMLRQAVGTIQGAKVGIEFEMYVPGVGSNRDDDAVWEPDYDRDTRVSDIDDIISFFDGDDEEFGQRNTQNDLRKFHNMMEEDFLEYVSENTADMWEDDGKYTLRDFIVNNDYWSEEQAYTTALDKAGLEDTPENRKKVYAQVNESLEEMVEDEWQEQGQIYERAWDEFSNDQRQMASQRDFLSYKGIHTAKEALDEFSPAGIEWPYLYNANADSGEADVTEIVKEFSQAVGKPVKHNNQYHGATRDNTSYIVEPDGSLGSPASSDDAGLEFVSPPMPVHEMLADLKKVKEWCDDTGCYTNRSTGLHINVSVPGIENLDYTKLALLVGDERVLQNFKRESNTYAKSAMQAIRLTAKKDPAKSAAMMDTLRRGLNQFASKKLLHSGETAKYTSINNKGNYIEFRGPGNDWLGAYYPQLETTILRFVAAVDAACNPEKMKNDYLKKLYLLLQPDPNDKITATFAQYAAGALSKPELRTALEKAREIRKNKKAGVPTTEPQAPQEPLVSPGAGKRWIINLIGGERKAVVAASHDAALQSVLQHGIPESDIVSVVLDTTPPEN